MVILGPRQFTAAAANKGTGRFTMFFLSCSESSIPFPLEIVRIIAYFEATIPKNNQVNQILPTQKKLYIYICVYIYTYIYVFLVYIYIYGQLYIYPYINIQHPRNYNLEHLLSQSHELPRPNMVWNVWACVVPPWEPMEHWNSLLEDRALD